jgi:hypothetical protein
MALKNVKAIGDGGKNFKRCRRQRLKNYFKTVQKPLLNRVKLKIQKCLPRPIEVYIEAI